MKLTAGELRTRGTALLAGGVLLLFVLYRIMGQPGFYKENDPSLVTLGYTLAALAAAGLVLLSVDESSRLSKALRRPWLVGLGRISYGFYFFHQMPQTFINRFHATYLAPHHLGLLELPLAFVFSWALAALSFRFWESPFLRLKSTARANHVGIPSGKEREPGPVPAQP